jgi:hypothetical protein
MTRSYNPPDEMRERMVTRAEELVNVPLECLVSPMFRGITAASYLALESDGPGPFELVLSPG